MERIALAAVQADGDTRRKNAERRSPNAVDECFACGRGLTEGALARGWWVHLLTDATLAHRDDSSVGEALDQGWFPMGSECAKRVPVTHRARMEG